MKTPATVLSDRNRSGLRFGQPVRQFDGTMMSEKVLRIGAVGYLNSKPLVEGLAELVPQQDVRLDYPSRLADQLASGELDIALIPSIEYFRGDDYEVLSDACVAAHGPVLSVKLYSRVPWGDIRTLALDEGSRTSATLARILLAERHGVHPQLEPLPIEHRTEETDADAILLIGDRAILPPEERFLLTWDLGEEWFNWTGLPFVFAMWVANVRSGKAANGSIAQNGSSTAAQRRSTVTERFDAAEKALAQSRDLGIARLSNIARREAELLGLSLPTTFSYLSENLQYHLGSAERTGLKLFYDLAASLELAPAGVPLRFRGSENRSPAA